MRRLTGEEHRELEFAAGWTAYDSGWETRSLLAYATRLTEQPTLIGDADIAALRAAGWNDRGIWEATALISFFDFTARMEAAAGLPADVIPPDARLPEAKSDARSTVALKRRGD